MLLLAGTTTKELGMRYALDAKAERLGTVRLFRHCTPKELANLASVTDEVTLGEGRALCRQGEVATACYVIIEGVADVQVGTEVVATVGPGECVGEMGLIDAHPRSAAVIARTPMRLYEIEARRFDGLISKVPSIARNLLRDLSSRIRDLDRARTADTVGA
jgi:CRP/FNR family transcriptional regulator, cyclic AMP receptor protein